jgi:hypothetical protein
MFLKNVIACLCRHYVFEELAIVLFPPGGYLVLGFTGIGPVVIPALQGPYS